MAAAGAARRHPRAVAAVLLMTSVLALVTACGSSDDNPYGLTDFHAGAGAAATTAPPGTASSPVASPGRTAAATAPTPSVRARPAPSGAVTYRPGDAFQQGAWVERGAIVAASPARQAVVDAALAYLRARVQLSNTWQISDAVLTSVATGQALTSARQRAQGQRTAQRHSIGPFVLNLSSVRISGTAAVVSGCPFDGTSEVSDAGSVMSDPPGGVQLTMDLRRAGPSWRVTTFPTVKKFCEGPSR